MDLEKIKNELNALLQLHPDYVEGMAFDEVEYKNDLGVYVPRSRNPSPGEMTEKTYSWGVVYKEVAKQYFDGQ